MYFSVYRAVKKQAKKRVKDKISGIFYNYAFLSINP